MTSVIGRSWPLLLVVLFGALVQGALAEEVTVPCQSRKGRKDTTMLCLDGIRGTDGCPRTGDARWDNSHYEEASACDHCDNYCARAAAQMLCWAHSGSITQDEVSYEFFGKDADPAGDLGHGLTTEKGKEMVEWAVGCKYDWKSTRPTYNEVKGLLQAASKPFRWGTGAHACVVSGCKQEGGNDWILVNNWNPNNDGSVAWKRLDLFDYSFHGGVKAGETPSARTTDLDLAKDSDNDGINDFDENKRFLTNKAKDDSDGDGIKDKTEVVSYTFIEGRSPASSPDIDGDGKRAELDKDTDDDCAEDGCEDLNRDGDVDTGETDPFDDSDKPCECCASDPAFVQPDQRRFPPRWYWSNDRSRLLDVRDVKHLGHSG